MYLVQKATQVTVDDAELRRLYAYPEPDHPDPRCHVRVNMVTSLDGAASQDGASAGLGGDGDKTVFDVLRALCDVVLVGSGTVTGEDYGAIDADPDDPTAPTLAIVSGSLSLREDSPAVTAPQTTVLTCSSAPDDRRRRLTEAGATLVDCGTDSVDLTRALAHLASRGRWRVLSEGGPGLLGRLAAADLVDELCLTIGPTMLAGGAGRIAHSDDEIDPRTMTRDHVLADDDGFLFTRWSRSGGER
ncbi:Pyrimidine reductase, riboflavin biosynthesis [Williamsia deligens]|nr:Pyrimidine reductase, riboflavin biosynthesis [Williamsia deligens]